MKIILYILFVAIFMLDYMANILGIISNKLTLLPELLSAIVLLAVFLRYTKNKIIYVDGKYIILFAFLALHLINGVIINNVSSGAMVAGLRVYMKYIPFFLLPMVFDFDERDIRNQLRVIGGLLLIQFPVAIMQRFFIYGDVRSGDVVRGTLLTSSFLSIALVCGIAMLQAYYIKKRISLRLYIILLFILFIPTTLNETKGTLILLPMAILIPILITKKQIGEKSKLLPAIIIGGILYLGFQTIYDRIMEDTIQKGPSVMEFFTDTDKLKHYLAPRTSGMVTDRAIGRIDRIVYPIITLSEDYQKLLVGLGMGNVTRSPIDKLTGDYIAYRDQGWVGGGLSYLLWETGILGVMLSCILMLLILKDSIQLSRYSGDIGVFALGWSAITCIVGVSLLYKDIIPVNTIMYPFWYFSGLVISMKVKKYVGKKEEITITNSSYSAS